MQTWLLRPSVAVLLGLPVFFVGLVKCLKMKVHDADTNQVRKCEITIRLENSHSLTRMLRVDSRNLACGQC